MKFSHFFIDRPIFAMVLSLVILLGGGLALLDPADVPVPGDRAAHGRGYGPLSGRRPQGHCRHGRHPDRTGGQRSGGHALYVLPIDRDGTMTLTVTFKLGTNLDTAQVLAQNRVATAEPRLPDRVRTLGVTTKKKSPNLMMVVNLLSPDNTYDQTYISNYAFLQIRDVLNRSKGWAMCSFSGRASTACACGWTQTGCGRAS